MRATTVIGNTGTARAVGFAERPDVEALLELLDTPRPAFFADAACREHPELTWFPTRGDDLRPIKGVCAGCLVRDECRAYAAAEGLRYGVFGGLSERERRQLRRA